MHINHEMFLGLTFKDDEAVPFQMCKNLPDILVYLLRANSMFALIRFILRGLFKRVWGNDLLYVVQLKEE